MGWWDTGIMGGDTPYDIAADVEHMIFGKLEESILHMPENWSDTEREHVRRMLNHHGGLDVANTIASKWGVKQGDETYNIIFQVVGLLIISSGAKLSDVMKKKVQRACREDAWALEGDRNRQNSIDQLLTEVNQYSGDPVIIGQKGLMSKIAAALDEKEFKLTEFADVESVGIQISQDGNRVWVCVDGQCVLRIKGIKEVGVQDDRGTK